MNKQNRLNYWAEFAARDDQFVEIRVYEDGWLNWLEYEHVTPQEVRQVIRFIGAIAKLI